MKLPFWPSPSGYRDIELGLSRVYDLLERLDNPHKKLPPTIHIAGTNGKGSTLSFLKAIFNENGYKTHTYTSPHLVNFNERIILADQEITDEFLNECLRKCKIAAELEPKISVTYFEGITVAAFLAFSKVKADILLLEVGMGGRLDATNVIEKNLLSIITPISLDHTEFLGKTLAKIAFEKAGIIKKNCPVIVAKQEKSALTSIKIQAEKMQSEVLTFGEDFSVEIKKNNFDFKSKALTNIDNIDFPSLNGIHQIENASIAIAASLSQKQFKLDIKKFSQAIKNTFWLGRLQKVTSGVFYNKLSSLNINNLTEENNEYNILNNKKNFYARWLQKVTSSVFYNKLKRNNINKNNNFELIIDGSHNLQGSETVKDFLQSHKAEKKILIFAMMKDKDSEGFLNIIKNEIDLLVALEVKYEPRTMKLSEILEITKKLKINSIAADNFNDAFDKILDLGFKEKTLIIISGSLYQVGNFLEKNSIVIPPKAGIHSDS